MKEFVWDKILSVEVDEIDDDHRKLVELLNILNHAVEEGESTSYIEAVLDELISGTVWHFKHEERLMLRYGYEELQEHKAEHEELVESAKALQQKFFQDGKRLSSDDLVFLEHWLTEHILVADMKLGAFLVEEM